MGDKVEKYTTNVWDINLRVGSVRMTLSIPRSPEVEQSLRRAADEVNTVIERYRVEMPHVAMEQLMSYVALDIANELQLLRKEKGELKLEERLRQLNRSLEETI
ncbi:cell division protein ZapA [uncultured Porphyromonas sp.]|uniref:cell division protein ZapA n=1 Tax=uncultured Porphyromonas sp. TaxID=159274 RepID=UPI00260E3382|nr:cell division protein ZapA [uncultured Porphyromonas sp.]